MQECGEVKASFFYERKRARGEDKREEQMEEDRGAYKGAWGKQEGEYNC